MTKTATIPAIRVKPSLREAAEKHLMEGETLSSFVEKAVYAKVEQRVMQMEFLTRAINSRDEALESGVYFSADSVHDELRKKLNNAKKKTV